MVYRVYVEKREGLAHEAEALHAEIRNFLHIEGVQKVRVINRYDVEGISEEMFKRAASFVLSEPQMDTLCDFPVLREDEQCFVTEYLPGQYDQRADSAAQCIQLMSMEQRPKVKTAKMYVFAGSLSVEELDKIKKYVINPVESREADNQCFASLDMAYDLPKDVDLLQGFRSLDKQGLEDFLRSYGLAMDLEDLQFCQQYFIEENRDPRITEIRMIDTYWSDHCRHTTFLTNIRSVSFADERAEKAWKRYLQTRDKLQRQKPYSLMDIATVGAKSLYRDGKLAGLDISEEINACTVKIKVEVDGREEDWLLLFKNETHNHPTEIEPFGGAATCIGGAIRDPLSGRAYVYAAMRVTGAADPTGALSETIKGKLPQRKIVTTAAAGYSSYGNQIGLATGIVEELYHPGYAAKRMEIGAVIAASKAENVRREVPAEGDVVILIGGRTGRDGCGGATGSSKAHKEESLESCGAEVQKGNAPEERKLQRLFRNEEAKSLIKRCNDFGAGGVSVAIGELAEGLVIDLDKVPKKYEGLDGTELAISESQERMAVVVEEKDAARFMELAAEENLEASVVAGVQKEPRLLMYWRGKEIVNLSRAFLNSNGAAKHIDIEVEKAADYQKTEVKDFAAGMRALAGDLNVCSKQGLSERFDSTIGAGTVLMPFGGKYQKTPIQAMVHKVSVEKGQTDTCSFMAYGANPYIMEKDCYAGAYLAVLESVSKLIAAGADRSQVYLSFQEYFERLGQDSRRWGKPLAALLGALDAQLDLEIAAIGGKDSMSGSFENLDVPPTLVSFAVTVGKVQHVLSPEFKKAGTKVLQLLPAKDMKNLPILFDFIHSLAFSKRALSVYTPGYGGVAEAIFKQGLGNRLGFVFAEDCRLQDLFAYAYASFVVELEEDLSASEKADLQKQGIVLRYLGRVSEEYRLQYRDTVLNMEDLERIYDQRLESVFPRKAEGKTEEMPLLSGGVKDSREVQRPAPKLLKEKVRVLIPAFPGTNCEYDSAKAIRRAGMEAEIMLIKNLSSGDIADSVTRMERGIEEAQIIFLPGGFSGGDEPDGSAKFITAFFRNPRIQEAVHKLLEERGGLMAGICNGFQALIKLGLLPYGKITDTDADSPTLGHNTIGRHQSMIVRTGICANISPWLSLTQPGEIYQVAVSHGEGRFICREEELRALARNGQIVTRYVDFAGNPTMDIRHNPNGSAFAVESICSPDGRIFGKMGHSERIDEGLYQNVPGNYDIRMFEAAAKYFKV